MGMGARIPEQVIALYKKRPHNGRFLYFVFLSSLSMGPILKPVGGGGGIRTHGALADTSVFKTDAFGHSATPPIGTQYAKRNTRTLFLVN